MKRYWEWHNSWEQRYWISVIVIRGLGLHLWWNDWDLSINVGPIVLEITW